MKDDQELTPLESLFQDHEPASDAPGFLEAADAADTKALAAAQPTDKEAERTVAEDAEMVALVQSRAAAAPDAGAASRITDSAASAGTAAGDSAAAGESGEAEKPYEELVRELEQIVRRLESGDITLDQSMDLFARGIELTRRCQNQLDAIEKKITILIENPDGSLDERPFGDSPND